MLILPYRIQKSINIRPNQWLLLLIVLEIYKRSKITLEFETYFNIFQLDNYWNHFYISIQAFQI